MNEPIYFTGQYRQFRDNLRRFIDQEIVPRAVMRQVGELGYLGIPYLETDGGFGCMHETTIARMVRDARVEAIGGGATAVMLEEVAKRL